MNLVHSYYDVISLLKDPSIGELWPVWGHSPYFYQLFHCGRWMFSLKLYRYMLRKLYSALSTLYLLYLCLAWPHLCIVLPD